MRTHTKTSSMLAALLIVVAIALAAAPHGASADVEDWQKGASIRSNAPEAFASPQFQAAVDELAESNANFVTLVLPWKQETLTSSRIYPDWATPSEAALVAGIQYAHDQGLQVNFKPHVDTESYDWRAYIRPDDMDGWFASYRAMLLEYARIAEANDVEMITIGSELVGTTGPENTQRWRDLIEDVRQVYSGDLTYSANWGGQDGVREMTNIQFWDDLDYIGLAAYFYFDPPYTMDSMLQQWHEWHQDEIEPLHEEWDRPVIFTEIGYRSTDQGLQEPWDWEMASSPNEAMQALGYEALFEYWDRHDYFEGLHLWDWKMPSDETYWGSPEWAADYTPQRKEAQRIMAEWFADGADSSD